MEENQDLDLQRTMRYSARERAVFDVISQANPERVSTKEIGDKVFEGKVFHVKSSVIAALASLKKKVDYNNEPFKIEISGHSGPNPMFVWLTKREE
jgi:hypothetical protein